MRQTVPQAFTRGAGDRYRIRKGSHPELARYGAESHASCPDQADPSNDGAVHFLIRAARAYTRGGALGVGGLMRAIDQYPSLRLAWAWRCIAQPALIAAVGACSAQQEPVTDKESVMVPSDDAGSNAEPSAGDESNVSPLDGPYSSCSLADAQEALATWASNDATDVWTKAELDACTTHCSTQSDVRRCVEDQCAGGFEYLSCEYGWRYYLASQAESACAETYRVAGCCVRTICKGVDDEPCLRSLCFDRLAQMDECASSEYRAEARDMCLR